MYKQLTLAILLSVGTAGGCTVPEKLAAGRSTSGIIDVHQTLYEERRYREAFALIQGEIDTPGLALPDNLAPMYALAIGDLAKIAEGEGKTWVDADPAYDRLAAQYFSAGIELAPSAQTQASLYTAYADYFDLTGRSGRAVPYRWLGIDRIKNVDPEAYVQALIKLVRDAEQSGNAELQANLTVQLSEGWRQLPEITDGPAEVYGIIATYYPSTIGLWHLRDPHEILDRWEPMQWLSDHCGASEACALGMIVPRLHFAKAFAIAGATDQAERFRKEALRDLATEPDPFARQGGEHFAECLDVHIFANSGARQRAIDAYERGQRRDQELNAAIIDARGNWWSERASFTTLNELDPDSEVQIKLDVADSKLAVGDPEGAAELYRNVVRLLEVTRSRFDLYQTTAFFSNPFARRAYTGIIKAELDAAGHAIDRTELARVLHAAELFRARQLREFRALRSGADLRQVTFSALDEIGDTSTTAAALGSIPSDAVLLYYVDLGDQLLVAAVTRDAHDAVTVSIDAERFSSQLSEASMALSNGSPEQALERVLLSISRTAIAPVAPRLAGKKRLLVVPDGSLNLLPFTVLSVRPDEYSPLIEQFSIVRLPALRILRGSDSESGSGKGGFLGVADPVYPSLQELTGLTRSALARMRGVTRNAGAVIFPPLPETRDEVQIVSEVTSAQPITLLLGDAAVESRVKAEDLSGYRFVHLATHGILGGDLPGVTEPALVLGREQGQDGLLTASEVAKLHLNADLAVLSACDTGSGEFVLGEGVQGMGRAFLVAGSRATVVSLWPVASRETVELMVGLYENLHRGMSAAQALRESALALRRKRPHPTFWAPFIVMGSEL